MNHKQKLKLVELSFKILNILEMRFGDGTGQDLQVSIAHKEIMGAVKDAKNKTDKKEVK